MKGGGGIATLAFGIAALVPVAAPAAVVAAAVGGGIAGASFVLREKELRFLEDLDYLLVSNESDENVAFDFREEAEAQVRLGAKERS